MIDLPALHNGGCVSILWVASADQEAMRVIERASAAGLDPIVLQACEEQRGRLDGRQSR